MSAQLLMALALAAGGDAQEALRVAASPALLVLGRDQGAELRISTPEGAGAPRLIVSAGSVEGLTRVDATSWSARYVPPPEPLPRVAIVAAVATRGDETLHGSSRILLVGQGDAVVRTRPGATISVRIRETTFGPVVANARGLALVPVEVPPGVSSGWNGNQEVDLRVPPTERLLLASPLSKVRADQATAIAFRLWSFTAAGEPCDSAPELTTTRGVLSALLPAGPGAFDGLLDLPPGHAGPVTLTARVAEEPSVPAALLTLEAFAGPPASADLHFEEPLVAGETTSVQIRVHDAAGNLSSGEIALRARPGTVEEVSGGGGEYLATVRAPQRLEGAKALQLEVVGGSPAASLGGASLTLSPGPLATVELRAGAAEPRADPERPVPILIALRDRFGNPVDAEARVDSERGHVEEPMRESRGEYRASFLPELSFEPSAATLHVQAGGKDTRYLLALRARPRELSAAARLGIAAGAGGTVAPQLSLSAALRVEPLGLAAAVEGELGWTSLAAAGEEATARTDLGTATVAFAVHRELSLGLRARAALGAGAAFSRTRLEAGGGAPRISGGITPWGFVSASAEWVRGRAAPFVELRGQAASFNLPLLRGVYLGAVALLGYRHDLL